ncbi:CHAT domain-containing protein [Planktothrix agardhii]|uniref:CHAT domain-containing protein n=2 Tax=Planktothrix agardhii TaxID=1160 RepID=UPI001F35F7C8|nr:CHAT domain-containing tetratricopeptide repeat protein [Planktothrix agardhii]MCF3576945.1 CHAT domain-containing protein [Planktothrix agardhii 1812]MCF3582935.1 CHAT domain-containing protein [Planktothrix agardhii 1811]
MNRPITMRIVEQLNKQVANLYQQNKVTEAISFAEQLLELAVLLYPCNHPDVIVSIDNLAKLYHTQGLLDAAEPLYKKALVMKKSLDLGIHPEIADSLNNLADLYKAQGKYRQAEIFYQQALAMRRCLFQKNSVELANTLHNLAELYRILGWYLEAEPLHQEALIIRIFALKGMDADIARSLNNLAEIYKFLGKYREAEDFYKKSFYMFKELYGENQTDVACTLNNLGELYREIGRYSEAEKLHNQALKIREKLFNKPHHDIGQSLNNLALIFYFQGKYTEAEYFYNKALIMYEPLSEKPHASIANTLNNIAEFYRLIKQYEKSKSLHIQALYMRQQLLNDVHPDTSKSLHNLAYVYYCTGDYSEAESLLKQALEINTKFYKGIHSDIACTLDNLGLLYYYQANLSQAESLFKQALTMRQQIYQGDHPEIVLSLNNLAILLITTARSREALELMQQAITMDDRLLRANFAYSSERDRLTYIDNIRYRFDLFLSLISTYFSDSTEAAKIALDVVIQRKCITATALAAFNFAIYSERYSHLQPEFQRLRSLREQLTHLMFDPPFIQPQEPQEQYRLRRREHQKSVTELQQECEQIEKQLASQVPEIQLQDQETDRRAVALALPEGSALVEFVRFDVYDFKAYQWQPAQYLAFVLPAQKPDAVQMILLGDAEPIERLIKVFRETMISEPRLKDLGMRHKGQPPQQISYLEAGIKLREAIYNPILEQVNLAEYSHLIIAPDYELCLVPFGILPEEGRLLIDRYQISYLSTGRDILRGTIETERPASPPFIMADPDFNLSRSEGFSPQKSPEGLTTNGDESPEGLTTNDVIKRLGGEYFDPLPETGILAETVAQKLGVKPYLQQQALEPLFGRVNCPNILLIATHGYFNSGDNPYFKLIQSLLQCPQGEEQEILQNHPNLLNQTLINCLETVIDSVNKQGEINTASWLQNFIPVVQQIIQNSETKNSSIPPLLSGVRGDQIQGLRNSDRFSTPTIDNSLMRSGLALAGANTWKLGGNLPPEAGKGFLFAQDVAVLDLWANELTILIACESGLGDVKIGEGVLGLRRAFAVSGCKTLVMSLWSVPTKASILLMNQFLDLLKSGYGRYDALIRAQEYIRSVKIEELQQFPLGEEILAELVEHRSLMLDDIKNSPNFQPLAHPYFWAAWVCQGNTTPFPPGIL